MTTNAAAERDWWKDVVCYQIWPMSVNDSNNDGHGDIQGIIKKLDYLKDLGVDAVWICPTYKSPMKDFGYDISDWQDVNPAFGTLADMELLIEEVHKRDMKILMDLVVTHTSNEHAWFKESRSSRDNPKHDWYVWKDGRPGNEIAHTITGTLDKIEEPTNYRAAFGGSAWYHVPERDQYYMHLFLYEEPDLNWENPETRQAIYGTAIGFWLDRKVDGFRIDTVNRLSKVQSFPDAPVKVRGKYQPGSEFYINGPKSHDFLKEMRKYMDNHTPGKALMLVGELPLTSQGEVLQYVLPASKELSMVFDFDMIKLGGHDNPDEVKGHEVKSLCDQHGTFTLPLFKDKLKKVQDLLSQGAWGTVFMENHDQPRSIARYTTPDLSFYPRTAKLLAMLQTGLSGTQFLYQGQELGMLDMPATWSYDDFRDPAARIYMQEECDAGGAEGWENARLGNLKAGRDNGRTPVQWSAERNAGFSSVEEGQTWIGVNPNYKQINFAAQKSDAGSVWHFWKAMIAARKEYRAVLMHGSFDVLDHDNEKTFTFVKTGHAGQVTILVCLNFSSESQPVHVDEAFLNGRTLHFIAGNADEPECYTDPLLPWEGRMFLLRCAMKAEPGRVLFPGAAQVEREMAK